MYVCMFTCIYFCMYWKTLTQLLVCLLYSWCCSKSLVAHAVLLSCETVVFTVGYRADSRLTQGLMLSQAVEALPRPGGELCWWRECIVDTYHPLLNSCCTLLHTISSLVTCWTTTVLSVMLRSILYTLQKWRWQKECLLIRRWSQYSFSVWIICWLPSQLLR